MPSVLVSRVCDHTFDNHIWRSVAENWPKHILSLNYQQHIQISSSCNHYDWVIKQPAKLKTYAFANLCNPQSNLYHRCRKPRPQTFALLSVAVKDCINQFPDTCTIQYVKGGPTQSRIMPGKKLPFVSSMRCWVFTWTHVLHLSVLPVLPFQISMSDYWSKNTNTVGTLTLYPQSRHWYAWVHAATYSQNILPQNRTNAHF